MSDLRDRLANVFGFVAGEYGVTGVTPVTDPPVTPPKSQSYAGYTSHASNSTVRHGVVGSSVTEPDLDVEAFEERAAIAEYDGGLRRPHAELLGALESAPLGPEHDRTAIVAAIAIHLDHLSAAGYITDGSRS
jgi:hypothetical protein